MIKLQSIWKLFITQLYLVGMAKIAMLLFDCKITDLDWTIDVIVLFIAIHLEIAPVFLVNLTLLYALNQTLSEVNIKVFRENNYFVILRNKIKRSYKMKITKNIINQN